MDGSKVLRLMIVENEHAMMEVLRDFFSLQEGISCCAAASTGEDALNMIYGLEPDVLLLDLVMPGPDGLAILEQLRVNPPQRRPRVLVISSFSGERIIKETQRLGADYYMIKPFSLDCLLARVQLLGREEDQKMVSSPLRMRIEWFLEEAGSNTSKLGHLYLVNTVEQMLEGGPGQYLNAIFRDVAARWSTSENGVAEAIRRDVAHMYRRCTPFYRSLNLEDNNGKPPSPAKFLATFAARVQRASCNMSKGGNV